MAAMTRSYAIVVDGEFKWLARKGDLVLSNQTQVINSEWFKIPRNNMANFQLLLYVFNDLDDDDDVPDFFEDGQNGKYYVAIVLRDRY
jgi:hypothetical protein